VSEEVKKDAGGPMFVVVGNVIGLEKGRYTEEQLKDFDIGFLTRSNHIKLESSD
tara:strand:+ start:280 stop:441 length:162 start_codon:yes stop_codon:yes gene_type:complete